MAMRKTVQNINKRGTYHRLKRAKDNYKPYEEPYEDITICAPLHITPFINERRDINTDCYMFKASSKKSQVAEVLISHGYKPRVKRVRDAEFIKEFTDLVDSPSISPIPDNKKDSVVHPSKRSVVDIFLKGIKKLCK